MRLFGKYLHLLMLFFVIGSITGRVESAQLFPDAQAMERINSAVFEVVVAKPTTDSLQYEKPLPLDLIPYSIRTDKYYSVGTAFAIGPNTFVTASHVLGLNVESQFDDFRLRDTGGTVFPIDKVMKYSDHRDFIVFSLKGTQAKNYFGVNTDPQMNQRVYAVGNALGQGIVVRDGLYTSSTPEEENGEWKWLRFSAAASPGNSGGPLLDAEGKVLGIVLRKSKNENLNYALPISEVVSAAPGKAVSHKKLAYKLDIMDMTKMATYEKSIRLPKPLKKLHHDLTASFKNFSGTLLEDLLAENRKQIFPQGDGADMLLHTTYSAVFPRIIMKGEDGNWDAYYPSETKRAELDDNGYFTYGAINSTVLLYIQKPDRISTKKFYTDSKLFMDLILQGIYLYRTMGSEKIKITSMGKAKEEYVFNDSYGRKWMVRTWLLEYNDKKILTFSLPVPGGVITFMKVGQTGVVNSGYLPDFKVYTDFLYLSYYGTFKQWKEFLTMKALLPKAFSTISLSVNYGKEARYTSKRISFSYGSDVMAITEKSDMSLLFSYFREGTKTVWDVSGVVVGESRNTNTNFNIYREMQPSKKLSDSYQSAWENIVKQKFPYNNSAYYREGGTIISTVMPDPVSNGEKAARAPFYYTVSFVRDGKAEQKDMETRLATITSLVNILERR